MYMMGLASHRILPYHAESTSATLLNVVQAALTLLARQMVSLAADVFREPGGEVVPLLRMTLLGSLSPGMSPTTLRRRLSSSPPGG